MRRRLLLVLLLLSAAAEALGSSILSVTTTQSGVAAVSIDPTTGAIQTLFNASSPFSFTSEAGTFDPVSRRLYFLSGQVGNQQLMTIDLRTNTLSTHSIAMPAAYIFFEWDGATQRVLALSTQAGMPIVSIDPATGTVQTLLNTNVAGPAFTALEAFDPVSRQLHFLSGTVGTQQLVTVDLMSSSVSTHSIAASFFYSFFVWDGTSHRILALTSQSGIPIVAIDPATGAVQPLFNTNFSGFFSPDIRTFDPFSRQIYFLSGSVGTQQLVIVDVPSATTSYRSIAINSAYIFFEADPSAASIPALTPLALLLLSLALAAAASFVLRH